MMHKQSIALVFGYLPEIDEIYEPAQKLGLNQRFAVALDTFRESNVQQGMYFDNAGMHEILTALRDTLVYDRVRICYAESSERDLSPWLSAADLVYGEEQDPFEQLSFISSDRVTCLVRLEDYNAIGGPYPYHDTLCFSFYVARVDEDAVRGRIEDVARAGRIALRDVLHGGTTPQISLLTKLKRLL